MKIIKTDLVLKDWEGKNLTMGADEQGNGGHDLTIGMVISSVLGGKVSNPTLGWVLGKKFAQDDEVKLLAEDIVFIKKEILANDIWKAIVSGQVIELLDEVDEPKSE